MKLNSFLVTFALLVTILSPASFAGSNNAGEALFPADEITQFAKSVERYAANQGARAFIIARVGRPAKELPTGIYFTHTALAIYSDITLTDGKTVQGYAIHNLYQQADNPAKSMLMVDYPVDFFWSANELTAGIIIPTAALQNKLINLVATEQHKLLHNDRYSVIANPFNTRFQNCTEFTLDMINAAIYGTTDIDKLKVNAHAYFSPQVVATSRLKLMLGSRFLAEVSTKDHKGKVQTATFSTIAAYLKRYDLAEQVVHFSPQEIKTL